MGAKGNALLMRLLYKCQNEILFNEPLLKISQKMPPQATEMRLISKIPHKMTTAAALGSRGVAHINTNTHQKYHQQHHHHHDYPEWSAESMY